MKFALKLEAAGSSEMSETSSIITSAVYLNRLRIIDNSTRDCVLSRVRYRSCVYITSFIKQSALRDER
jgi:hypothetical protein